MMPSCARLPRRIVTFAFARLRTSERIVPAMSGARRVQAPVVGEIAAGQPIHAYEDRSETMALPSDLTASRGRETFVLRVRGKSMIEDHIDDGDFVVVQEQNTARDGDIIVALLEDNVATLKRFYKEKDR